MATSTTKAQYVTKRGKYKHKDGTVHVTETRYRVDPAYRPQTVKDICTEFMENYLDAHSKEPEVQEWAADIFSRTEVVSKGKNAGQERPISPLKIRSEFAAKFFPEIIKGEPEKKPTFAERMAAKFT